MMEYRGYKAQIDFDDEDGLFRGQVINIRDGITFQGASVDTLRRALRDAVEDYLTQCAAEGREPAKPFSGTFVVRLHPDLHRSIAGAAQRDGKSLNAWITDLLARTVGVASSMG